MGLWDYGTMGLRTVGLWDWGVGESVRRLNPGGVTENSPVALALVITHIFLCLH